MSRSLKNMALGSALTAAMHRLGVSADEASKSFADAGAKMAALQMPKLDSPWPFGKSRYKRRNRLGKLARRVKTTC